MQVNRLTPEDLAARYAQPVSQKLREEQQAGHTARADQAERTEQTAKAGQSFLRENPAPDPREGVVMNLSNAAREEDGVVRKVETPAEKKEPVERKEPVEQKEPVEAKEPAAQPKTSREAIEEVADKRDDRKAEAAEEEANPAVQPATSREAIEEVAEKRKEAKVEAADLSANPAKQPATSREAIEEVAAKREEKKEEAPELAPARGEKQAEVNPAQQALEEGRAANMSIDRMRDEMMQRQQQQLIQPVQAA
ncbi:MAG: hypothetical protein IJQ12_10670 [Lachnospiraceae bacterium]|nr:hypothetical protein [Lachnospiraceae bacterium]